MTYSKYKNKKTIVEGISFDSKREATYYLQYKVLEKFGKIKDLVLQERFPLVIDGKPVLIRSERYPNGRTASYRADFSFYDVEQRKKRILDCKGVDTDLSRLKRALVECIYSVTVEIVR